jgi:hypothetical protein
MKQNITLLTALIILASCGNSNTTEKGISVGFAKGIKVSSTGLKTINDGLTLTDSYLAADGVRTETNEVQWGKKVAVVFEGIEGFKEKNGKVFPELSIVVLDDSARVVISYDDLLNSDTGYNVKDATVLTGALTVGDPLKQGRDYTLTVTVGDKEGGGTLMGSVVIKVK